VLVWEAAVNAHTLTEVPSESESGAVNDPGAVDAQFDVDNENTTVADRRTTAAVVETLGLRSDAVREGGRRPRRVGQVTVRSAAAVGLNR
jgi:hypothetical protein